MDDAHFSKMLEATIRAALFDAIEQGQLVDPEDYNLLKDTVYGPVDRRSGERGGGLVDDIGEVKDAVLSSKMWSQIAVAIITTFGAILVALITQAS